MARILHTAVSDEIREIEKIDPIQAAEMRMESIEYANEVRGFYDYDSEELGDDESGYERDEEEEAYYKDCEDDEDLDGGPSHYDPCPISDD